MDVVVDIFSSERISGWVRGTAHPQRMCLVFGDRMRIVHAANPRPDLPTPTAFMHTFEAEERAWLDRGGDLAIHLAAEYSPRFRLRLPDAGRLASYKVTRATQKPIAIIGTSGQISQSWQYDSEDVFALTGLNTGNLAFQYGVYNHIASPKQLISYKFDPDEVRSTYRVICIPAANYLYHAFDFADYATRLERCGLPLLVVGLGMQAQREVSEVSLKPGTERLLKVFAEQCHTIGVRGEYSAEVLTKYGIQNFSIIGCPSNFINPDPNLGRAVIARYRHARERFAYAPTLYPQNSELEALIAAELGSRLAEVVCQEPLPAIAIARGESRADLEAWLNEDSGFLSTVDSASRAVLASRLRCYFGVDEWLEAYRRLDAVLGLRIHGAALGWQAGRAACVVSHDLRTEELARTMGLPLLRSEDVRRGRLLVQFEEAVAEAASSYDKRRAELAKRYCELFQSYGVTPSPTLWWLIAHET